MKEGNIFRIVCKECGYEGTTTTTKSFPVLGTTTYHTVRYVCPKCMSRNIEYKPREGMEWMSGMVRKWEKNTKSKEK